MQDRKKTKKADLENKRVIFTQIGFIIALAVTLFAFELKSYEKQDIELLQRQVDDTEEELVEITRQDQPPPPPPPPQQHQTQILEIVEDDVEIDDEIEIDVEDDMDTEVEDYVPVVEEEEEEEEVMQIFSVVEEMPSFPGGDPGRIKYLSENIQYPQMAKESGIQGTVYITFVVERDGSVTDVRILRGIGGGCDEEAIRVVKNMPRWAPGKQRGKPVRVQYNLPIKFQLN